MTSNFEKLCAELENQVRFLEDKAKPSTPSAEMLQEYADGMVAQALEEARNKHERELASASKKAAVEGDRAVQAAKDEERKKVQAEMSAAVAEAEEAKKRALERLSQLESSAKVSASPEILKFKFYFDEVQKYLTELQNIIRIADEPTAEKLANAFDALLKQFGESNGI